jgi:hypothetical protein
MKWNDGENKRHRSTCPHSGRGGGPKSAADDARVRNLKAAGIAARAARRMVNVRVKAVASFPWDSVRLVSTDAARGLKLGRRPFLFSRLNPACEVCGAATAANVDILTMERVVCDACLILRGSA